MKTTRPATNRDSTPSTATVITSIAKITAMTNNIIEGGDFPASVTVSLMK